MSQIDDLLNARAAGTDGTDIDALLDERAKGGLVAPKAAPPPAKPLGAGERFTTGLADMGYGLGQLAEHVAETPLNLTRRAIRSGLNAVDAKDAASLFHDVSTDDFDNIVSARENDYQQARDAAGQTGIDWWRIGGNAANPLNYVSGGAAAETALARVGQAAVQGGALGAAQPTANAPGDFWWQKAKNAATGFAAGAGVGTVVESVMPALRAATTAVRKSLGDKASAQAATVTVNDSLRSAGVDPKTVDLNLLGGMRQDVQQALEHGAEPSKVSIVNRAKAESLPFPVRLMRGQATGDPALFSAEQNMRGIQGVGEPITARLQEQNAAFIANLDALGAKNAPDPVSAGQVISDKVQKFWDGLQSRKDALYAEVKNSQGQSATMDQFTAMKNLRDALDTPQASHAYDLLPSNIKTTIEDLEDGKLPLTVAQMQSLDKIWGAAERGADGSTAYAIGQARKFLNDAPLQDDVGQQALAAYKAARQAHAQQMSLVDPKLPNGRPNQNFQPLVKDVVYSGTATEKLFQKHFMGEAPSVANKNLNFMTMLEPKSPELIGKTMMGEVKRQALSSASDERGTVSQAVLSGWARDPVKSARLDALLPKPAADTFRNLADVVEAAKRQPVASTVNNSNTGSALLNAGISMAKQGAAAQIFKRAPIVKSVFEGLDAAKAQTAVGDALSPGVTLKSLVSDTPVSAARKRLAARAAIPAAVLAPSVTQGGNDE